MSRNGIVALLLIFQYTDMTNPVCNEIRQCDILFIFSMEWIMQNNDITLQPP